MAIHCLTFHDLKPLNEALTAFARQFKKNASSSQRNEEDQENDYASYFSWWFNTGQDNDYASDFTKLRFNIDTPLFFIAQHNEKIEGVMVVVLQQLPHSNEKAWYFCDLKIAPHAHNVSILMDFVRALRQTCKPICDKAYALSMNDGKIGNRILRFAINCFGFHSGGEIYIERVQSQQQLHDLKIKGAFSLCEASNQTIMCDNKPMKVFHLIQDNAHVPHQAQASHKEVAIDDLPQDFFDHNLILCAHPNKTPNTWGSCSVLHKDLDHIQWDWLSTLDM